MRLYLMQHGRPVAKEENPDRPGPDSKSMKHSGRIRTLARTVNLPILLLLLSLPLLILHPFAAYCTQSEDAASAGPVTITEEKTRDGHMAVRAVFEIEGNPDTVYETLRDASEFPEFMPNMKEVRILESGPGYHIASFLGGNGILQSRMIVKRMFADAGREISWYQLEGQAKELEGFWLAEKENEEGRCRVTYQTYVDAGSLVPDGIVREYIKKGIHPMVSCLQKRIRSGGTWKSETFLKQQKKRSP